MQKSGTSVRSWSEALDWDFARGRYPGGWGWGSQKYSDDFLELTSDSELAAVYILPIDHRADFVLVAEFMVLADEIDGPTLVHMMTRDLGGANHESGCVLSVEESSLSVYHKVNGKDYLLEIAPLATRIEIGRWHRLRFTANGGSVVVHLDGDQVFRAEGPFPPGLYGEPYVAAENGTVRVRQVQVLEVPPFRAAGGNHPAGGNNER